MLGEKNYWSSRDKKQVLIVAGCMAVFVFFLVWWNDPNKSPEKIRKEVTKRYINSKAEYVDIRKHCQDFIDTCGCGAYELNLDTRDRFSQRCNIYWREDKQYGYFNDRQVSILKDFMFKEHIAGILIYSDSISFIYADLAHDDQYARLNITRRRTQFRKDRKSVV